MDTSVAAFQSWLTDVKGLAAHTAEVYAGMVDFGLRRGKVLTAVRRARTRGSLKVATAAVRAWGQWTGNPRLAARASTEARKRKVKATIVSYATEEERAKLVQDGIRRLEEPYRSTMVVLATSGLRLPCVLDLSRIQVEAGRAEQVPIPGPQAKTGWWSPPDEVRAAFHTLSQYGGWDILRDLFGRDYTHAYFQIRTILHFTCRKAKIRYLRPTELGRPGNPIRYPADQEQLDEEVRCA